MRNLLRVLAVPLWMGLVAAACSSGTRVQAVPGPDGAVPVPAELRAAHAGYLAAWNAEDPQAVGAYFTADTHGEISDSVYHGRDRIVAGWVAPNLPVLSDLRPTPTSFITSGNQITETGTYRFRASPPGGTPMVVGGRYVHVWTRQPDGSWRITAMTVSGAEPVP